MIDERDQAPEPAIDNDAGWSKDKNGRWYAPARGRSGLLRRKGNETVDEAAALDELERASGGRKTPKGKPATKSKVPKAPAPTKITSIELEHGLAELFCSPSFAAGMRGEQWAANHFTKEGPVLARNLTAASEHNPWLRSKLESALTGEDIFVKLLTLIPVASALIAYAIPPVIYYLDPPFFPAAARDMFGVPDRKALDDERKREREEELRAQAAEAAAEAERAASAASTAAAAA